MHCWFRALIILLLVKKKVSSGHIPNRFDILLKQIEEITLEQLKRLWVFLGTVLFLEIWWINGSQKRIFWWWYIHVEDKRAIKYQFWTYWLQILTSLWIRFTMMFDLLTAFQTHQSFTKKKFSNSVDAQHLRTRQKFWVLVNLITVRMLEQNILVFLFIGHHFFQRHWMLVNVLQAQSGPDLWKDFLQSLWWRDLLLGIWSLKFLAWLGLMFR